MWLLIIFWIMFLMFCSFLSIIGRLCGAVRSVERLHAPPLFIPNQSAWTSSAGVGRRDHRSLLRPEVTTTRDSSPIYLSLRPSLFSSLSPVPFKSPTLIRCPPSHGRSHGDDSALRIKNEDAPGRSFALIKMLVTAMYSRTQRQTPNAPTRFIWKREYNEKLVQVHFLNCAFLLFDMFFGIL